jgi:hypothetical protein
MRCLGLFLAAFATSTAVSFSAFAGQWGWSGFQRGAVGCRTENSNVHSNWAALVNGDSNTQTVWCPIDNPGGSENSFASSVVVWVSRGWATPRSCTVAGLISPNTGYFYEPVVNNVNADIDDLVWNIDPYSGNGGTFGLEVQCDLASGAFILGYDAAVFQQWDWSTW